MAQSNYNECSKSELDLFAVPNVQTNVEKGQWIECFPISNITDSGPIEFNISGSGEEYTDLRQAWILMRAKITKADGTNIDSATDKVGPANLFLQSLLSQIDVSLNEKVISDSTNTNPYRAMISTLLTYGSDAKTSQLTSELFYKDTAGKMDVVDPVATGFNTGLNTRHKLTKDSATVEMMGPIHSDLFHQDRLLLNGVSIRIRMNRSKNAFCLLSSKDGADFKVNISHASLFIRKVKVTNDTFLGHATALEHSPAFYPIRRVECKVLSIPTGNMSFTPDDVFLGQIPKRIVIGLVENAAFNGAYNKNPFNFQHFKATEVGIYVNGEAQPMSALKLNFETKQYLMGYMSLFSGTGTLYHNQGNKISRDDYPNGYALYAFDLSPDLSAGPHISPTKQGNLRLGLQFAEGLPSTVNCIIYAEFDSLIQIDSNRNISYNWSG